MQAKPKQPLILICNQRRNKDAKGFELYQYKGYSILKVTSLWPNATTSFYFEEKNAVIPDSLKQFSHIAVPLKRLVTSTTHIPALEILGVETP
jgi:iron complex transport system substrate-binding protein